MRFPIARCPDVGGSRPGVRRSRVVSVGPPGLHLLVEDGRAILRDGPRENHARPSLRMGIVSDPGEMLATSKCFCSVKVVVSAASSSRRLLVLALVATTRLAPSGVIPRLAIAGIAVSVSDQVPLE